MIFFIPEGSKLRGSLLSCFKYQQLSGGGGSRSGYYSTSSGGGSGNSFYQASAYERAKSSGQSSYNWFNSKLKEAGNIWNSWTKGMEKTVKHFCTTAKRIKKDAVRSVKAANIAIGISAITIGKMKLEQLKKKLPNINISIDYTGTWKDSLQLGLGIVTTGGGLLLTLAGGGSEIASVGSSSAISIPAATEGIGIAGSGLAISFDVLRNMFDVRIQKSESSKGDGGGKETPSEYNISSKQFGKKWGKHKIDYPDLSMEEYRDLIDDVFKNPDKIIRDVDNNEFLYLKGENLLRITENGDFVSLYPGANSDRVLSAIEKGGTIWQK